MIRIFGRQPFFAFHHLIYQRNVEKKMWNQSLSVEIIEGNIKDADMGYFSIRMLMRVLRKNPKTSVCYLFRQNTDRSIIGFAIVCFKGAKEIHYRIKKTDAFITSLGVFDSFRRKGYSQIILENIERICFENNLKTIRLAVDSDNLIAISSYEKYGFKLIGKKKFIRVLGIDLFLNKTL